MMFRMSSEAGKGFPLASALGLSALLAVASVQPTYAADTMTEEAVDEGPTLEERAATLAAEIQTKWDELQAIGAEQKDQVVASTRELLQSLDDQIANLEEQATSASDAAKETWAQQQEDLEALRADAADRLESLEQSTRETWDSVYGALAENVSKLVDAANAAAQEF